VKTNWNILRNRFLETYRRETDSAADKFALLQKVANLQQGQDQSIVDYLRECEDLNCKLPNDQTIGFNVIKGMKDKAKQSIVNFECNKERDFAMERVKLVIQAAYQTVGRDGPFDHSLSGPAKAPDQKKPDLNTQIHNSFLQGMRSLTSQNEAIMKALLNTTRGLPKQMRQNPQWIRNPNITCFGCGQKGHYKSDCPVPGIQNTPPFQANPPPIAA
jgi:hypothetical protein